MIGFLFFLALQPISRKTECRVNVQVVYSRITQALGKAMRKRLSNIIYH